MSVNSVMTALADAIRSKSGKTGSLTLAQMTEAVNGIPVGGTDTGRAMSIHNGSTTAATMDTGLQEIFAVILKKESLNSKGLVTAVYVVAMNMVVYTYCTSYSEYFRTHASVVRDQNDGTIVCEAVGGTFTFTGSGDSAMVEGDTYLWYAIGYE